MSTRPDSDLRNRDPRFDAAWRSASTEVPPAALDTAILAAAHREAGARPQGAVDPIPEATRPERWWFPLAAAATIGAIALGLLQIAGQDPSGGTDAITAVVSDMPAGPRTVPRETVEAPAPVTATTDATSAIGTTAPLPTVPGPSRAQTAERAAEQARPESKFARSEPAAPATPASGANSAASAPGSGASLPREAPRAPMPLRSPEPAALMGAAKLAAPAADRATVDAPRDRRDARIPLPVAEWIALIRKLRDAGRDDEAAKELTAFRNLHPDHEQLLPPDLSRWQPGAK